MTAASCNVRVAFHGRLLCEICVNRLFLASGKHEAIVPFDATVDGIREVEHP
jgi:hypothetical protein